MFFRLISSQQNQAKAQDDNVHAREGHMLPFSQAENLLCDDSAELPVGSNLR
jgi:hypothetical protein